MHGDFSPRFVSARTAVHKLTVREKFWVCLPCQHLLEITSHASANVQRHAMVSQWLEDSDTWTALQSLEAGYVSRFPPWTLHAHSTVIIAWTFQKCTVDIAQTDIKKTSIDMVWHEVGYSNFLTPQLSVCMSRLIVLLVLPAPMAARSVEACHWSSLIPTFSCCATTQHDSEILFLHEV